MTNLIAFFLVIFLSAFSLLGQESYDVKMIRKHKVSKVEAYRTLVPGKSSSRESLTTNNVLGKHLVRRLEFDDMGRLVHRTAFANFYNEESNLPDDRESMDEKYPWQEQHIYNDKGQLYQKIAFPERDSSRKIISTYLYDDFGNVINILSNVRKPQTFNHLINADKLIIETVKVHSKELVSYRYNKKKQLTEQVNLIPNVQTLSNDTIVVKHHYSRRKKVAEYFKGGTMSHMEVTHFDRKKRIVKRALFLQKQEDPIQINFYRYNKMGLIREKIVSNEKFLTTVEFQYSFRK